MNLDFAKQPVFYDIKISKENCKLKLEKRWYKLKIIKENNITKVMKKYIDADNSLVKSK